MESQFVAPKIHCCLIRNQLSQHGKWTLFRSPSREPSSRLNCRIIHSPHLRVEKMTDIKDPTSPIDCSANPSLEKKAMCTSEIRGFRLRLNSRWYEVCRLQLYLKWAVLGCCNFLPDVKDPMCSSGAQMSTLRAPFQRSLGPS